MPRARLQNRHCQLAPRTHGRETRHNLAGDARRRIDTNTAAAAVAVLPVRWSVINLILYNSRTGTAVPFRSGPPTRLLLQSVTRYIILQRTVLYSSDDTRRLPTSTLSRVSHTRARARI